MDPSAVETDSVNASRIEDVEYESRLDTFQNWNYGNNKIELARAGFIYTGTADKVECPQCGVRLYNWQDSESPILTHKKYAPDCRFMRNHFPVVEPREMAIPIKYPYYADYDRRMDSYRAVWPLTCNVQRPHIMSLCGFFYIGSADRARCFHCGITLRDWDASDLPPTTHKRWSPECPFLLTLDIPSIVEQIHILQADELVKIEFDNSTFHEIGSQNRNTQSFQDTDDSDHGIATDSAPFVSHNYQSKNARSVPSLYAQTTDDLVKPDHGIATDSVPYGPNIIGATFNKNVFANTSSADNNTMKDIISRDFNKSSDFNATSSSTLTKIPNVFDDNCQSNAGADINQTSTLKDIKTSSTNVNIKDNQLDFQFPSGHFQATGSSPELAKHPSVMTVIEFGFTYEQIMKVINLQRSKGQHNIPSAVELYKLVEDHG